MGMVSSPSSLCESVFVVGVMSVSTSGVSHTLIFPIHKKLTRCVFKKMIELSKNVLAESVWIKGGEVLTHSLCSLPRMNNTNYIIIMSSRRRRSTSQEGDRTESRMFPNQIQ